MRATSELEGLERRHPGWKPWLALLGEVLGEIRDLEWDNTVPEGEGRRQGDAPMLAGAALGIDVRPVGRLFEKLRRATAGLPTAACVEADPLAVFGAALNSDADRLRQLASDARADPEAFRAVAALLPIPFLHACSRCWAGTMPRQWRQGYCPVCGTWPAFAQICGVERSRYLRCGRCGSAWQAAGLSCPYCGTSDHEELASLVVEQGGPKAAIEVCERCLGYLKTFTALRVRGSSQVILDDLASVELDLVAAWRGYRRPEGVGHALDAAIAGSA